jgi:glucose-1-phosphate adenylyltransferase
VDEAEITHSVIGLRSIIGSQVIIRNSILMGADSYETEEDKAKNKRLGRPDIGIGEGSIIEAAIIDKNVHIGQNMCIFAIGPTGPMMKPKTGWPAKGWWLFLKARSSPTIP